MYRIHYMLAGLLSAATCLDGVQAINNPLHAKVDRVCLLSDNKIAILYESAPGDHEKICVAVLDAPEYASWKIAYHHKLCGQSLPISFGRVKENALFVGWPNAMFLLVHPNTEGSTPAYMTLSVGVGDPIDGTRTRFFIDRKDIFVLHNHAMHMLIFENYVGISMDTLYSVNESYEYAALAGETEKHVLALGQSHGDTQKVRLLRKGKCEHEVPVAGILSGLVGSAQNSKSVIAMCSNNSAYVIDASSGASKIINLLSSLGAYSRPAVLSACGKLLIYAAQQDEKGNRGLHIIEQEIDAPQRNCVSTLLNAPGNYVQAIVSHGKQIVVQTNEQIFHMLSTQKIDTEPAEYTNA